jgi:dimethylamine monooxygenase subunit A
LAPILHPRLPVKIWMDPRLARLPGTVPMAPESWLAPDAAYDGQMAERARLIDDRPEAVHAQLPVARAAADELHALVSDLLPGWGFRCHAGIWTCPDGRQVQEDPAHPLLTLGQLVQDDLCLLQPGPGGEHVLTAAILCFPASWTLAEKIGRPLVRIHRPVASYDPDLARRVQRLFDAIRPGTPLMRGNALAYADPTLFQPRREGDPRVPPAGEPQFIRSELQGLVRLPESEAVVFSIRTHVVDRESLSEAEATAFAAWTARNHAPLS